MKETKCSKCNINIQASDKRWEGRTHWVKPNGDILCNKCMSAEEVVAIILECKGCGYRIMSGEDYYVNNASERLCEYCYGVEIEMGGSIVGYVKVPGRPDPGYSAYMKNAEPAKPIKEIKAVTTTFIPIS